LSKSTQNVNNQFPVYYSHYTAINDTQQQSHDSWLWLTETQVA